MVVSIVKGKGRDISSVSQRVEGVGEGFFLFCNKLTLKVAYETCFNYFLSA